MKAQSITFQTKNAKDLNILKAIGEALHLQFAISTTTEASYDKDFVKKIALVQIVLNCVTSFINHYTFFPTPGRTPFRCVSIGLRLVPADKIRRRSSTMDRGSRGPQKIRRSERTFAGNQSRRRGSFSSFGKILNFFS